MTPLAVLPTARAPRPANVKPRPWRCTGLLASYCPLCGDCSCTLGPSLGGASCPLHGAASYHGTREGRVA